MRRSRRYVKYFWIAKGITFDIDDEFVWCKSMSSSEIDEPKDPHLCSFCRIPQNPPDGGIPQKYLEKILKSKSKFRKVNMSFLRLLNPFGSAYIHYESGHWDTENYIST